MKDIIVINKQSLTRKSCFLSTESSRLEVLAKSTEDRSGIDHDVIALEEPGAGLGEDVAGQLTGSRVGWDGPSELGVEGGEVVGVEEVQDQPLEEVCFFFGWLHC